MAMDIGWTALRWPGMEHVVVSGDTDGYDGYQAEGRLIMAEDGLISVRYSLSCGPGWRFRTVTVRVTSAAGRTELALARQPDGGWLADGRPRPDLGGCDDIDIDCTPLTNTLPIRRLDWAAGQAYDIDVAYVSVPDLNVRKARQRYTELGRGATAFRYQSGSFQADLDVDADGFVLDYPGIWRRLRAPREALSGVTWHPGWVQAKRQAAEAEVDAPARVHPETVQRLERSMGALGTAVNAAMEERLPWFRKMSAENRSWLGLVAQAGIAAFIDWIKHPERQRPAVTEVFGTAPRELARAVRLQHAVEMVRVIIDVVETQVDTLAAPGAEAELREAVLIYAREIAFSAAQVYARSAEARGAWDARLEALVVDSLVRGEAQETLNSWASALNWSSSPVSVIVGSIDGEEAEPVIDDLRAQARRARLDLLAGVQGSRLILVLGGTDDPMTAAEKLAGRFGPGPVVVGPPVRDLRSASVSARAALAGLRAAPAWPDAPRPTFADELLPERALDGDADAAQILVTEVYEPLLAGGPALLDTLTTYLEQGSSLEATARMLFVHPNTVRYRLRRVAELTEYTPSVGRDGFTLWVAIIAGRLAARRG